MIGFVILNYNSANDVIKCVHSIIDTYKEEKRIVVVDNCSTDDSYNVLNCFFRDNKFNECSFVKTQKNGGFAYGNNCGIEILKQYGIQYAILANADVIFKENAISCLVKGIQQDEKTVMYAPVIRTSKNEISALPWKRAQSFIQYLGLKSADDLIYTYDELKKNNPTKVYMVSGCCYAINIGLFKYMGAFDENTFLYNEEGTVGRAVLNAGYKMYIDIDAEIIHNHGASTGTGNIFVDTELIMSGLYYWKKYENSSNFRITLLWLFFCLKIFAKALLHKYDTNKGLGRSFLKTGKRLLDMYKLG